jgi:uncharacterized protein YceK
MKLLLALMLTIALMLTGCASDRETGPVPGHPTQY